MTPTLKIKKLFPDAILPSRAHPTDSGLDLYAYRFDSVYTQAGIRYITENSKEYMLLPQERLFVNTGISATVGKDYEIQIRPRSGLALKQGLIVLNTPGTVDESYRGALCVILANLGCVVQRVSLREKIAQMVVCPVILCTVEEVESLDETDRSSGGFGSTGV